MSSAVATLPGACRRLRCRSWRDAAGDEAGSFFDYDHFLAHALADFDDGGQGVGIVSRAHTISSSFILCTGLKKCMPTHFLAR